MSAIRPLYDRVVIRRDKVEEVSEGGIVLPGGIEDEAGKATVVAVGQGKLLDDGTIRPMTVKEGDRVIVSKGTGAEVEFEGETLVILPEQDIVGVLS